MRHEDIESLSSRIIFDPRCLGPGRTKRCPTLTEEETYGMNLFKGYAGSRSCIERHEKFYKLWSTSFHGLSMQPYTAAFAKAKRTAMHTK